MYCKMNRRRFVRILAGCVAGAFWQRVAAQETVYLPLVSRAPTPTPIPPPPVALKGISEYPALNTLNASWSYQWWYLTPPDDPRVVPMISRLERMEHLTEAVECARASGWLMGFNEPDYPPPAGSLIAPLDGAIAWRTIEEAVQGIKLLSPAPSQEDFGWLWRMVAEYERLYRSKPRFDAIGCHYYGLEPQGAKQFLLGVREEIIAHGYGASPLWLTEFAGFCCSGLPQSENGNERMMRELIPWLQEQPWIDRFAWFISRIRQDDPQVPGCGDCALLDYYTLEPTPLGELYASL